VPTAKASVLAWLAMAAPGAGDRPRFAGKRAIDVFHAVVGHDAGRARGWFSRWWRGAEKAKR
jgi:hypothetical protein